MGSEQKTGFLGDRSAVVFCAVLGVGVAAVLGIRLRTEAKHATGIPTATIEVQKTYQTITGFGASTAYYQDWLVGHPQRAAIYRALYGELKLDILRLRNTFEPGKAGFASAEQEIFSGASKELGYPPQVMLSSWSPPQTLKSTGATRNGGTLAQRNGTFAYAGFAGWWRDSVVAYRASGLAPDFISIQNEPDWKDTWETCLFRPTETSGFASYGKALSAVVGALATLPNVPKVIGPETLGANNPQTFLAKDQTGQVSAVAHHLYSGGKETAPDSFIPQLNAIRDYYPNLPKFQTEFGRGDGFQTAWLIHNCLTEEDASAYLYWAAVWPAPDALITVENPWQKSSWKLPEGFTRTDRFYALEHYSRFIRPGYIRIGTQTHLPGLKLSAFLSPDKKTVVAVAVNTSDQQSHSLGIELPGYSLRGRFRTSDLLNEKFSVVESKRDSSVDVPPHGTVTLVFYK